MNPGNTKNNSPKKIDLWAEQVNKKIARLMGKKGKLPPPKKTSNLTFSLIIFSFTILLWLATGFYYLSENQSGLVLEDGKVVKIVKGIKVGFTAPYPFGSIEIIDGNASDLIDIGKMSLTTDTFTVLSQDLKPVAVEAKFAYQVVDPKLTFQTSLQQQDNLDTFTAWQVQTELHKYFLQQMGDKIVNSNLTVVANEIRNKINISLANRGLKVSKLNIYSLKLPSATTDRTTNKLVASATTAIPAMPPVAVELLQQAAKYKQNVIIDTKANINQFNQLLPQYKINSNAIVAQMYYDTLSAIPVTKTESYPLLSLPLSQLLSETQLFTQHQVSNQEKMPTILRERHFGRDLSEIRDGSENE